MHLQPSAIAFRHTVRQDPCVVCLHGLQSNKEMFAAVEDLCARRGQSFFAMDFLGFGESARPEDFSYALEDQAVLVAGMIEKHGLEKFILVGHSMGGMVGTMLLERFREQLLGFINMEGNFVLEDCGASLPVAEASFEDFSEKLYPALKREAPARRSWLEQIPDYAFHRTSRSIVDWSRNGKLLPMYVASPVRKLFVYGERNRRKKDVLPPSEVTAEIPGAGHFLLTERPAETLAVVQKFLQTVGDEETR